MERQSCGVVSDEQLAKELQEMYDEESTCPAGMGQNEAPDVVDLKSITQSFTKGVGTSGQFRIVLRRGADLFRKLSVGKREARRDDVSHNYPLRVCYAGKQGVDTGAMVKEFFTSTLR